MSISGENTATYLAQKTFTVLTVTICNHKSEQKGAACILYPDLQIMPNRDSSAFTFSKGLQTLDVGMPTE